MAVGWARRGGAACGGVLSLALGRPARRCSAPRRRDHRRRARRRRLAAGAAGALAHGGAGGARRRGPRPGRFRRLPRRRGRGLRDGAERGDGGAAAARPGPLRSLLGGEQRLSAEPLPRLQPDAGARAGGGGARGGGAAARADGFALQPAPHRAALPGARLRRDRDSPARPRHRAGRPHRGRMGGLARRDPARHARGAAPGGTVSARRRRRLLERRRAGARLRPRRDRRSGPRRAQAGGAVLADDRRHRVRPLRRARRVAGGAAGLRQRRLAERRAGVQPVQVQFLSGQRRAPVLSPDPGLAGAHRGACARRQPRPSRPGPEPSSRCSTTPC